MEYKRIITITKREIVVEFLSREEGNCWTGKSRRRVSLPDGVDLGGENGVDAINTALLSIPYDPGINAVPQITRLPSPFIEPAVMILLSK